MRGKSKLSKTKVFLDTSAILAGLNNVKGGAAKIIKMGQDGKIDLIISERVLRELHRNITCKFPLLWHQFTQFCVNDHLEIINDPSTLEVKSPMDIIDKNDAPILAAAIKVEPDFLITWNTKHFLTDNVRDYVKFIVCTPADFLKKYWKI